MNIRTLVVVCGLMANSAVPGYGWWGKCHHLTVQQALELLPDPPAAFFGVYGPDITAHVMDSDTIRRTQRHTHDWLDLEALSEWPCTDIPADRAAADAKYGKIELEKKLGLLPWQIALEYRTMVKGFRSGDHSALVNAAAYLAHHLADAHMPFHTSLNFNGKPVGNRGVHTRIEKTLDEHIESITIGPLSLPSGNLDPFPRAMDIIRRSYGRIFPLLYYDTIGFEEHIKERKDRAIPEEYSDLIMEKLGQLFTTCLEEATREIAFFWYSAWVEAGKPALPKKVKPVTWHIPE